MSGLPTLRWRMKHRVVRLWQRALVADGRLGENEVTGRMCVVTDGVTAEWQAARGLSADGEVGPKTWARLAIEPAHEGLTWSQCLLVDGRPLAPPPGVTVTNFLSPDVPWMGGSDRVGVVVDEVVAHESCTRSVKATLKTFKRRSVATQFLIDPAGPVVQIADLANDRTVHAVGKNGPGVGLEYVGPYYASRIRDGWKHSTWRDVLVAPWVHRGRYAVPPLEQLEAGAQLIAWLADPAHGLGVKLRWPGLIDKRMAMGRVPSAAERRPGIYAHHYTGHSDGAFPVLYAWLRLEGGLAPEAARVEAIRLATGARKWVDVSAHVKG